MTTGLSGYLLLFNCPHTNIYPMVLASIDALPIIIGKLFMVVALYIALPLNIFPARTILF
jgi:hypothetical protein